jgi:hypothetical protein
MLKFFHGVLLVLQVYFNLFSNRCDAGGCKAQNINYDTCVPNCDICVPKRAINYDTCVPNYDTCVPNYDNNVSIDVVVYSVIKY